MSTRNIQTDDPPRITTVLGGDADTVVEAQFRAGTERPFHNPASDDWASLSSFVLAGICGLGLLVVVFGAYLIRSDALLLIGAGIMCLGAIGWVFVAILMVGIIVKRWLTFPGTSDKVSR